MIEITNNTKGPIQVMVRSKKKVRSFTVLTIPGVGSGKIKVHPGHNKRIIEDEAATENIELVESFRLISTRRIKNKIREN